jgi:hypothetical protein
MTKVENMVKETERQENRKVAVTDDKFSIETSVTFWRDYFNSGRPRRRRAKLKEAEPVVDDGVII